MDITATGKPSDTVITKTVAESYDSEQLIQYFVVDASDFAGDEYIEVTYNSETLIIDIIDECRYTPIEVHFINNNGAQQTLTFFKASTEKMKVTDDEFESDRGQASEGNHQFVRYNIQGKTNLTVNSGFVNESLNDAFKQLILSEKAWIYSDSIFTPINVSKKSIEYKTRQKDRLINYEFEFEYSYNEINNI